MAKHMVKCLVCGEQFDANEIPFVKEGRRYRHKTCNIANKKITIKDYLTQLLGKENLNYSIIQTYLNKYKNDGYKEDGILATLKWWYEIQGNTLPEDEHRKRSGGLGLIPYIYGDAREFYAKVAQAQENNKYKDYTKETITVKMGQSYTKPKRNFFESIEGDLDGN